MKVHWPETLTQMAFLCDCANSMAQSVQDKNFVNFYTHNGAHTAMEVHAWMTLFPPTLIEGDISVCSE